MTDVYLFIAFSFVFVAGVVVGATLERLNGIRWRKDGRKGFVRIPVGK